MKWYCIRPSVCPSVCPAWVTSAKFAAVVRPAGYIDRLLRGVQVTQVVRADECRCATLSAYVLAEYRLVIEAIRAKANVSFAESCQISGILPRVPHERKKLETVKLRALF